MQLEKSKKKLISFEPENSSGQGPTSIISDEIRGWNWGACLLGWVWALGNKRYDMAVYSFALGALSFLLGPAGWIGGGFVSIFLGARGSESAWQSKEWRSIRHFKQNQRAWAIWGIPALFLNAIIMLWVGITGFGIWHI